MLKCTEVRGDSWDEVLHPLAPGIALRLSALVDSISPGKGIIERVHKIHVSQTCFIMRITWMLTRKKDRQIDVQDISPEDAD